MYLIISVFFDTSNYWIFLFNIYLCIYLLYLIAWQNWKKNLNCFFLVLYLTNTNYTYTLMSEGKKRQQQKLLQNNKWLKGIKKDLVKKKNNNKNQQRTCF